MNLKIRRNDECSSLDLDLMKIIILFGCMKISKRSFNLNDIIDTTLHLFTILGIWLILFRELV